MRKFSIQNFLKMSPQVPQYSERNQNYLLSGVFPLYYLENETQEEQVGPLAASIDWSQISGTIEENITHIIPSTQSTYNIYAVSSTSKVYGITNTTITDLGYPSGSAMASNAGNYLAIANNTLFMTNTVNATIYKMPLPSGSWSTCSGTMQTAVGPHILEPFLDFIAVKDGPTSFLQGSYVRVLNTTTFGLNSGTIGGLDLGTGWGIIQMRNYNNKYLAIGAGQTSPGGTNGYPQNYIFLWDGISSRYNYSVKVPGKLIDIKVINSVLYAAVQVASGKTCLYYLSGTKLSKVLTTQISTISKGPFGIPSVLFDFKNYVGIHLNDNSDLTEPILVWGKDEVGEIEFVHSSGRRWDQICPGYDGNIYANKYVALGNSEIYILPQTGNSQQILYKSQWINIKNAQAIDIYYDTPPVSGTDAINVTIYGQGEDIINGNSTTTLDSITPTNYLNKKRTRLDLKGFTGDQIMIKLSTVNSSWRPIIRQINLITK